MAFIYYAFLSIPITDLINLGISSPLKKTTINDNINQYIVENGGMNLFIRTNKPYYSSFVTQINLIPQKYSANNSSSGNVTWISDILTNLGTYGLSYYNTKDYTYTPSASVTYSATASKSIASSLITSLYNYNSTSKEVGKVFSQSPLFIQN